MMYKPQPIKHQEESTKKDEIFGATKKYNTPEEERALILDHFNNYLPRLEESSYTNVRMTYSDKLCPLTNKPKNVNKC